MSKLVQIPSSTQNSGAGKKIQVGKKNTPFLLTHSILSENDTKVIFSKNKKNAVPLVQVHKDKHIYISTNGIQNSNSA